MASLLYFPRFQVIYNGVPLAGGLVHTYAAGTVATPKATYTDSTAVTPNANPVVLDSQGMASIWLVGSYKIVTATPADVPIDTTDNIVDFGSQLSGATAGVTLNAPTITNTPNFTGANITWSGNPTHSGNHTFTGNVTVNGNTQLGNAGADTLRIDPNAVTWTNNPTHSGNHIFGASLGNTFSIAGGAFKVFSDGRLSGNKLHNIGAVTGTTDEFLASGTYTPTTFNTTNVASSAVNAAQWIRLGNVVIVGGYLSIDPTAASVSTVLGLSLPIPSNFPGGTALHIGGTAQRDSTTLAALGASIIADEVNQRATLRFVNDTDVANNSWSYLFMYLVL